MKFCFFILIPVLCFSQNDNYKNLSRLTLGYSDSNFFDTSSSNQNSNYKSSIDTYNSQSIFIDYRFFTKKNHSFKTGLFLNKFNKKQSFQGDIFVQATQQYISIDNFTNSKFLADKTTNIEVYLDYNYLFNLHKNFYLQLGIGLSYVHNRPSSFVDETVLIGDFFEPNPPYQLAGYGIYIEERIKWRYHISTSLAYKTKFGMVNLGVKYSIPFLKRDALVGNMTFFDPGPNGENYEYNSFFKNSGKYFSYTLSFTPSKSLFKKKK